MNVTETSAEGLKREFKIVVPANEVEDQISRRLGEIGQNIRIPGFRPGKVPMQLLRKRYGQAIRGEVLEHTVQESSAKAITDNNLRPAMPPRVELVSATEGADLEYTMSLEILPEMPEPDFASLGLEKLIADVPDEDIDRAIERLAESQRKAEPVERPAESGDILVVDTVGRIGEEEIPGSRGEDRNIELGGEGLLPGFTEQLTGVGVGEKREVRVTFPADYGNPDMAGKEAVFEVTVKEVRHRLPAKIDDELATALGLENLAELRQDIRERMQRDYDNVARQHLKRMLLDKLAERYDFPVPPGMVEMEFNSIWSQYEAEKERRKEIAAGTEAGEAAVLGQSGGEGPVDAAAVIAPEESALEGAPERSPASAEAAKPEQHETTAHHHHAHPPADSTGEPVDGAAVIAPEETALEGASDTTADALPASGDDPGAASAEDADDEKARAEFHRIAERRVRLGLLLAEVGKNNNINVSQEELNQALIQEARRHPGYERQVIEYYRKNPDAINNLRAPIFEEKVVDFIVELAKPGERKVTPQELVSGAGAGAEGEAEAATPA